MRKDRLETGQAQAEEMRRQMDELTRQTEAARRELEATLRSQHAAEGARWRRRDESRLRLASVAFAGGVSSTAERGRAEDDAGSAHGGVVVAFHWLRVGSAAGQMLAEVRAP